MHNFNPMREKTKTITIRVTEAEYEALDTLARSHRKPITTYVTQNIRAYLRQGEPINETISADILNEITETKRGVKQLHRAFIELTKKLYPYPDNDVPGGEDESLELVREPLVGNE